jgi:hypothetical protein
MQLEKKPRHVGGDRKTEPVDECDCMNCRLARIEAAIGQMQESVLQAIDKQQALPGMPRERNRMNGKRD